MIRIKKLNSFFFAIVKLKMRLIIRLVVREIRLKIVIRQGLFAAEKNVINICQHFEYMSKTAVVNGSFFRLFLSACLRLLIQSTWRLSETIDGKVSNAPLCCYLVAI